MDPSGDESRLRRGAGCCGSEGNGKPAAWGASLGKALESANAGEPSGASAAADPGGGPCQGQ
ncbi:hypothetical protein F751_3456 [Auxenochlorella protothecoides]|uniref:Uncharacterized protein n=1 Tax=Auxenochlorella protothecoides TaxID=3075 RepID=A0A087SC11_AUXPR|nr:hypothetical protein F751_3456 [Auxenochlorella protothecoides]KFM23265.1 hypothetical protein F751_3456 [Auxenochlorella protothecoides]